MNENKGKFGATLIYILTRPLAILPLSFHRVCGKFIAFLLYKVFRYRRDESMVNIARCFPDLTYHELQDVCRRSYAHLGKLITEALWFGACTRKQDKNADGPHYTGQKRLRRSHIVEIENVDVINELYHKGKSIIMLACHAGNWELYAGQKSYTREGEYYAWPENSVSIVYRKQSVDALDKFIGMNRIAPLANKADYDGMVESFNIMRYILTHKNTPHIYQFNMDQFPYGSSSRMSIGEFLHQDTITMTGAPIIAHKLGMAVVFIYMAEKSDGNYSIQFETICEDASTMSSEQILKSYYNSLETKIKAQPWNYLWTHKRWK